MSLKSQIEVYVGSIPVGLDDSDLQSILANGVSDIIRKVKMSNPSELWLFTKTDNVPNSGLSVDASLIYDVALSNKPCEAIPVAKRHRAAEETSIEYATGEFPVYYVLDSKVFILPEPGIVFSTNVSAWATYNSGLQTEIQCNDSVAANILAGEWVIISKSDENTATSTNKY